MKKINFDLYNFFHFYLIFKILNFFKSINLNYYIKKNKYLIILIIFVILIIRIIYSFYLFNYKYGNEQIDKNISLVILSKEKETETYISYLVKIKEKDRFTDKFILNISKDKKIITDEDTKLYYTKYGNFKYGDIIKIKGKIFIPKKLNNLHEFDYKRFLNSKNLVGTIMTYDAQIDGINKSVFTYIYRFRDVLGDVINSKLPTRESNLFKSMIYGDDTCLDENIKENFTKLGLSHLLAVSGSNVGIVILILSFVFKNLNFKFSFIINCLIIFVFCAISDFEISVIRASVISIFALYIKIKAIKVNKFIPVTLAFTLIIIYNPCSIFNVSFILSFTAFIGIMLFFSQINSFFNSCIIKLIGINNYIKIKENKCKRYIFILYKLLKFVSNILSLYFSVQILLIPIQVYFFNSIQPISLISNLTIYVFSTLQLVFGFIFILLCKLPFIVDIIANLNYLVLWIIIKISEILIKVNVLEIKLPTPDFLCISCYYIIVIITFYGYKINFLLKYKFKNLKVTLIIKLICILSFSYIIYFNIYTTFFENFVYYFNVEQGNMSIIKFGSKAILVDMGTTGNANIISNLESFLKAYNIDQIDFFLVTHLHSDHINGLFKLEEKLLKNEIKIESIIYAIPKNYDSSNISKYTENSISFVEFENFINRFKIKQIMVEKFDKISLDNNVFVDVLNPRDNEIIKSNDKVNSNSIIAMISINNSNFLFMGDSTNESEEVMIKDILDLENKEVYLEKLQNIKVIQVGHHGSNTSTSEYFLKNIKAKLAVISSKKVIYGHPSREVLNLLKKYNIKYMVTESKGGIIVKY
ncbi:MAG: internalization-related competence protein ComEC/Rec2 [Clostridia bacterium]|jgi:competence protein ComEC|nr:internalization-related competence protein ComEC/Rec2 [Clostridia bacterium]